MLSAFEMILAEDDDSHDEGDSHDHSGNDDGSGAAESAPVFGGVLAFVLALSTVLFY